MGIATAYAEDQVIFVTPPVNGWTLVVAPNATFHNEGDDHPTRFHFGRVRRVANAATQCEWNDRAGLFAHALDGAIIRAMAVRPLLVRLAEEGGA